MDEFKCISNDLRKILFLRSKQCFVKKDKRSLIFLGQFVLFVKKIWDGLPVPKGYFVLGTLCPKDQSVTGRSTQGRYVLGRFVRGRFVRGRFVRVPLKLSNGIC
jgi:hypothetical protein